MNVSGRTRLGIASAKSTLAAEALEKRVLLATVTWDGGAGSSNWLQPENWTGDVVPSAADDVVIGLGFNVELNTVSPPVRSLLSESPLTLRSGGVLELAEASETRAPLTLINGTLKGSGDLRASGGIVSNSATILGTGSLTLPSGSVSELRRRNDNTPNNGLILIGRRFVIEGTLASDETQGLMNVRVVDSVVGNSSLGQGRIVIGSSGVANGLRISDVTSSGQAVLENAGQFSATGIDEFHLLNTGWLSTSSLSTGFSSGTIITAQDLVFTRDFLLKSGGAIQANAISLQANVSLTIESGVATQVSGFPAIRSMSLQPGARVRIDSNLVLRDSLVLENGASLGGAGTVTLSSVTLQRATLWGSGSVIASGMFSTSGGTSIVARHMTVGRLDASSTTAGTSALALGASINDVTYPGSVTLRGQPNGSSNLTSLSAAVGPTFATNVAHPENRVVFGPDSIVQVGGNRTADFADVPLDNQGKVYIQAGATLRARLRNDGVGGSQSALFDVAGTFNTVAPILEIYGRWNLTATGVVTGGGLVTASLLSGDLWLNQPLNFMPGGGSLTVTGKLHFGTGSTTVVINGDLVLESTSLVDLVIDLPAYLDVSGTAALSGIATLLNSSIGSAFVNRFNAGVPARIISSGAGITGDFGNQRMLGNAPPRRYVFALRSSDELKVLAIPGIIAPANLRLTSDTDTGWRIDDAVTRLSRPTFTGSAPPHSTVTVRMSSTVLGQAVADEDGVWLYTPTVDLPQGSSSFTASAADGVTFSPESLARTVVSDRIAPVVTTISFSGSTNQSTRVVLSETFSGPVAVTAVNLTSGQVLTVADFTLTTFPQTNSFYLNLRSDAPGASGLPHAPLGDGDWQLTMPAGSFTDVAGNPTVVDATAAFTVLLGDANRDRVVDFTDLLILAQNYGRSGRNFAQGNFDYSPDGLVSFDDLLLLAQRYGTSLSTAVSPFKRTRKESIAAELDSVSIR